MSIKWAEVYFQPVKTFILFNVGDIFMGSKAEHLVTLIVVSGRGKDAGALLSVVPHRRGRVNSYSTTGGSRGT